MPLTTANAVSPGVYYVSPEGDNTSGGDWKSAYTDPQAAIEKAAKWSESNRAQAQVRVMRGTYTPKTNPNNASGTPAARLAHFSMRNGVTITGGFSGGESDGHPTGGETIFSGDLSGNDIEGNMTANRDDNVFHVFYHPKDLALDNTAVLQNITITGGNADDPELNYLGGGMFNEYSNLTIIECVFKSNSCTGEGGGGIHNNYSSPNIAGCSFSNNSKNGIFNSYSDPRITNCNFSGNTYSGMYNHSSSPYINRCNFSENLELGVFNTTDSSPLIIDCAFNSNFSYGMSNYNSNPNVIICTFSANLHGGIRNFYSSPTVDKCSFIGNLYDYPHGTGGGISNFSASSPIVTCCVFTGNAGGDIHNTSASPTYAYCIVGTDLYYGNGSAVSTGKTSNLIVNSNGTLPLGSPAIDAGDNPAFETAFPSKTWTALVNAGFADSSIPDLSQLRDCSNNPRFSGSSVDIGAYETAFSEMPLFIDVDAHWAEDYINFISSHKYISGVGGGKFEPDRPLTRAQLVQILYKIWATEGSLQPDCPFTDTAPDEWYYSSLNWAYAHDLVQGTSASTFAPNNLVTREQMAVFILRLSEKFEIVLPETVSKSGFFDDNKISPWAYDAVYKMQQSGIISGRPGNLFDPLESLTRAEMAKIICNVVNFWRV